MTDETPPPFDPLAVAVQDGDIDTDADPVVPSLPPGEAESGDQNRESPFRVIPGGKKSTRSKPPAKPRPGSLVPGLEKFYGTIGTMVVMVDRECGSMILRQATECAESLEELAREDPNVRRILMQASELGAWGKVLSAHLPIMSAIAFHHTPLRALRIEPVNTDEALSRTTTNGKVPGA